MKKNITKKLLGLALSIFSITLAVAQCPTITNLNVTLGTNGTASITPVITGTVSPSLTMYYWQITPNSATQNSTLFQSQGQFQFPTNGTYNVCLNFSDSLNGCMSNQYCNNVNISNMSPASCNAAFTAYTDSNCITRFSNTSLGSNLTYDWLINGTHYNSTNPIVTLPNGNYPVLLQTYYAGQPCDSVSQNIAVGCSGTNTVYCNADFTSYTDSNCVTYFTNTSTGNNLTYQWYDTATNTLLSTSSNPTLNIASGVYYISLHTYSNGTYCDSTGHYLYVNCNGTPPAICQANAQFSIFPDSLNTGNFYAYNNSSGSGNVTYEWNFGDGTPTSTQQYPFHQYATPGSYIICLTVNGTTSTSSCTSTHCDSSSTQRMASGFLMSQIQIVPSVATNIKQVEANIGLKAFPNPITDELTIEATTTSDSKLNYLLMDAIGRTVLTGNLNNSKATLNTSTLEKGFYSLSITNEKGSSLKTIKLVK